MCSRNEVHFRHAAEENEFTINEALLTQTQGIISLTKSRDDCRLYYPQGTLVLPSSVLFTCFLEEVRF